jgi:hypothetical protein
LEIPDCIFVSISHSPMCSTWTAHIFLIFRNFTFLYYAPMFGSVFNVTIFIKVPNQNFVCCSCFRRYMCPERDVASVAKHYANNMHYEATRCITFQTEFRSHTFEYTRRHYSSKYFQFLFPQTTRESFTIK